MRVLVATNMYPDAGRPVYGEFVRVQVESLRRAGHEIEVLFIDGQTSTLNYARGFRQVRLAAEGPFDLLHAHYGLTGFLAVRQRRLPVVITFHGDDLLGTPRRNGKLTRKSRLARRMGRWAARRAAANVVVSSEMLAHLPEGRARERATVLPLGIDTERFRPLPREEACRRLGLDPGKFRLLFAADPEIPRKRFGLASAAAAILHRHHREIDLHVVCGRPPEEMPLHMNASNVLLLTSMHEGSPMVLKEALSCNLPVISVPAGDAAERLAGIDGCRVVPADVDAITAAIEPLLAAPRRIEGRPAVASLSIEAVADRLSEIYRRAVDPA